MHESKRTSRERQERTDAHGAHRGRAADRGSVLRGGLRRDRARNGQRGFRQRGVRDGGRRPRKGEDDPKGGTGHHNHDGQFGILRDADRPFGHIRGTHREDARRTLPQHVQGSDHGDRGTQPHPRTEDHEDGGHRDRGQRHPRLLSRRLRNGITPTDIGEHHHEKDDPHRGGRHLRTSSRCGVVDHVRTVRRRRGIRTVPDGGISAQFACIEQDPERLRAEILRRGFRHLIHNHSGGRAQGSQERPEHRRGHVLQGLPGWGSPHARVRGPGRDDRPAGRMPGHRSGRPVLPGPDAEGGRVRHPMDRIHRTGHRPGPAGFVVRRLAYPRQLLQRSGLGRGSRQEGSGELHQEADVQPRIRRRFLQVLHQLRAQRGSDLRSDGIHAPCR